MAWQNPIVRKNTNLEDTFGISIEFTDGAEFATNVFRYSQIRIVNDVDGRNAFKASAEAARDLERTRRQNVVLKETAILSFMNS